VVARFQNQGRTIIAETKLKKFLRPPVRRKEGFTKNLRKSNRERPSKETEGTHQPKGAPSDKNKTARAFKRENSFAKSPVVQGVSTPGVEALTKPAWPRLWPQMVKSKKGILCLLRRCIRKQTHAADGLYGVPRTGAPKVSTTRNAGSKYRSKQKETTEIPGEQKTPSRTRGRKASQLVHRTGV